MTTRRRDMLRVVVAEMVAADGEPMEVAQLQVKIESKFVPRVTKLEIDLTLRFAEEAGLVRGTTGTTSEQLWAITNKGRLAEL